LCLAACSSTNEYGDYPPYPASGQLLINGQPVQGILLVFHLDGYVNDNKVDTRSIMPQGSTDANGNFVLSTYKNGDGAPAGDYHVTVRWPSSPRTLGGGPDKMGGKFSNPNTSGLTAHVDKTKNELKPFDLQINLDEVKPTKNVIKKGVNVRTIPEK
jgi:hypothetical protein